MTLNISPKTRSSYCSVISHEAGESLIGTAQQTSVYLLLEYSGRWGEKAFEESQLPERTKSFLSTQVGKIDGARLLLVKRPDREQSKGMYFMVASTAESDPALYVFKLERYEDLLGLDIPAILAGAPAHQSKRVKGSILLICTNGRRDLCCNKFGAPVYNELRNVTAMHSLPIAWQSSHVGGHRFAPNLLCLPEGLMYGRVQPEEVETILKIHDRREIYPLKLRGRVCYPPVVQAADYLLRKESGEMSLEAYRFLKASEERPGEWTILFAKPLSEELHRLAVEVYLPEKQVFESCSLDKKTPVKEFLFKSHEIYKQSYGEKLT